MDFIWILDNAENQPTAPKYDCIWNDGTVDISTEFLNSNIEAIDTDFLYHIYHKYGTAGIYDISCTMHNMVSDKTINKTVSLDYFL